MVSVFLPCRAGSERVPNKNTKPFANNKDGLVGIKLRQLLRLKNVDNIVLSTNDEQVIDIASRISKDILIDIRSEELSSSATSTDDLIKYVPTIIKQGHILWTHVTSPFFSTELYDKTIEVYFKNLRKGVNDSLMSVNKIQSFLWTREKSFNYDSNKEKWPRTQTLQPLFEVNSGVFINSYENYLKQENRIGENPFLYETDALESFDIDWKEDFDIAEIIYSALQKNNETEAYKKYTLGF